MRHLWTLAGFVLLAAGCGSGDEPAETTVPPSSTTSTTVSANSTTTTASVSDHLIQLPAADAVAGDAPVRLADAELAVTYLRYVAVEDGLEGSSPPESLTVELHGCSLIGPGVVVYDLALGGDADYPVETVVFAYVSAGDVGTGTGGHAVFNQPGRQLLVSSLPDQIVPFEAVGQLGFRNDRYGNRVERGVEFGGDGMSCNVEMGPNFGLRSNYVDMVTQPAALQPTAPLGTVESLAQAIYADGDDADLLPIAVAYGEALRFYSELWFVPDQPGHLDRIEERLEDDGCLELEFVYADYTITQSLHCPLVDAAPIREVGSQWFAIATDGRWVVTVAGDDETLVTETAMSLKPYWHLFNRTIPLEPVDETVMGRTDFQGGEVLVTFGEQRCEGTCNSPETWFYIYRVLETGLEQYAHYPGYGECLLVEEDEFVLAVAPDRGSIEVEAPGLSGLVTGDDANPFFFESTADGPFSLRVLDEDGSEARCVGALAADGRGGIGPFPGSSEPAPEPEADRTATAEACASQPWYLDQFTNDDPLRQACVDTGSGRVAASLVLPNEILAEDPEGGTVGNLECLIAQLGSGSAARCFPTGTESGGVLSGWDEVMSFSALVPEGTSRIVAVTSRGTEVVGIPHDRLATVWWLYEEGDVVEVIAETDVGPVTLYPEG